MPGRGKQGSGSGVGRYQAVLCARLQFGLRRGGRSGGDTTVSVSMPGEWSSTGRKTGGEHDV